MANYTLIDCYSGNTYEVYFDSTASLGTIWSFSTDETETYCGIIQGESTEPSPTYTAITEYDTCYDCFTGSGISVLVEPCNGELSGYITSNSFPEIPQINSFYKLCNPEISEDCLCFEILGFEFSEDSVPVFYNSGPFNNCDCSSFTTTTANTPYEVCLVCCPCESGSTITSLPVPHPTFTDLYGNSVIQGNAVLIGGNGLNS